MRHFEEPATAHLEDGEVVIGCPDGDVTAFTPEAALKSAHRIERIAVDAIVHRGRDASEPA